MELENINGQRQEQPFSFNVLLSTGEEPAKIHILFSECESTFCLDGTIDSEQDTFIGSNFLLHCFPLSGEPL